MGKMIRRTDIVALLKKTRRGMRKRPSGKFMKQRTKSAGVKKAGAAEKEAAAEAVKPEETRMDAAPKVSADKVFHYFREIAGIPHGSGHTKAISDHIVSFAKERDLFCVQDELNNVIITKEATPGYEDAPPIALQGHVDMGVKNRRSQKMQQAQKTKVLPFVGCAREEEHRSDQLTFFHFSDQPISESRPNLGIVVEVMSFVYKNKIPRFAREHALFSRPIVELERIHRSHDKVVHGPEVAACRIRLGTIPLGANVKHLEHSLDPLIDK